MGVLGPARTAGKTRPVGDRRARVWEGFGSGSIRAVGGLGQRGALEQRECQGCGSARAV